MHGLASPRRASSVPSKSDTVLLVVLVVLGLLLQLCRVVESLAQHQASLDLLRRGGACVLMG
jgi:hypothetical protein